MAGLSTHAPATLAPSVLAEVGLVDRYARFDSPIGPLVVAWNGLGVSTVEAVSDDAAFEAAHLARTGRPAIRADRLPDRLATAIARRLGGDRRVRIDLDLRGHTDFERDVWHKALEIPRGEVRPYGWIAAEIGRPKAVRAVGTALGHNPVPLIVPCHRVVRTDGSIGQYSLGGPENKRTILEAEGLDLESMEQLASSGVRFIGSRHDEDLLPADLPSRPPGDRPASARVPLDGRGAGPGLSGLPGVPAGLRVCGLSRLERLGSGRVDGVTIP